MILDKYIELNIYDSDGRHEFPIKSIPKEMSQKWDINGMKNLAMEFAREWFTAKVIIEDAEQKFKKETGRSLNLPIRRIISVSIMEDHYDAPRCLWQKRFDKVN